MKKVNLYWPVYKNLEKEILELTYHIHFCDTQINLYSVKIAELLVRCAVEIESISKTLYQNEGGDMNPVDSAGKDRYLNYDSDCLKMLDKLWLLSKKKIILSSPSMYFEKEENLVFSPLRNAHKGETNWQKAYQAVKHNRVENLCRANIMVLVRIMAALYLLNIYYKDEAIIELGRYMAKDRFDNRLGSDLFSVKYSKALSFNKDKDISWKLIPCSKDESIYIIKFTDRSYKELHKAHYSDYDTYQEIAVSQQVVDYLKNNPDKSFNNINAVLMEIGGIDLVIQKTPHEFGNALHDASTQAILNKNQEIYPYVTRENIK